MAKKAVKKKKATKKKTKNVKTTSLPKALPPVKKGQEKSENRWLCTISVVMFVFFLMTIFEAFGEWVVGVQWWIWLLLAIILGYKPMMRYLKK